MIKVLRMMQWDMRLQARQFLFVANAVSTAVICGFVLILPMSPLPVPVASALIFTDPALIGMAFVGAIVLMEKDTGVISAIGTTPSPSWVYVFSKAATLSFSGFLSGLAVAWVALGDQFDVGLMLLALTLSNIVAVLIGFAGVARAPSMNALMIYLLYGTVILFLPLLVHFSVAPTGAAWIFGVIPSYAMLLAFNGAADPASLSMGEWIYAIGYQLVWIAIGWRWAMREFRAYIISSGR
tara:strand:- start:7030 stop:7746 length:717 start_codon:yes stop_codon:yes gene_type:complete